MRDWSAHPFTIEDICTFTELDHIGRHIHERTQSWRYSAFLFFNRNGFNLHRLCNVDRLLHIDEYMVDEFNLALTDQHYPDLEPEIFDLLLYWSKREDIEGYIRERCLETIEIYKGKNGEAT